MQLEIALVFSGFLLDLIRHPEVAAERPSKDDGPGRASFEARCARASG
jgi:hypothetical protein